MRIVIIGATGLVGGVMLKVLEESHLAVKELVAVASEKSLGKEVFFKGQA